MKRILIVLTVAVALALGLVAVAYAYGPGAGAGRGFGRGMMGGGPGFAGGGYGMMGGGHGMMGDGACPLNGGSFDPARMATMADNMVTQHKSVLANLQAQLAAATDDATKTLLTARIELQTLMVGWAEGRATVAKALPSDWLQAEVALSQNDVDFWSKATATDANNQALIANRLAAAKQRLAYFQAEQAKQTQQ